MSLDLELSSRRALVTGGTKGVGAAVAELLQKQGAKVIATAVRHQTILSRASITSRRMWLRPKAAPPWRRPYWSAWARGEAE
jgi:NAD(P)-dependent dehydrogenase (short-subunit alcohol dehydrogenase family)